MATNTPNGPVPLPQTPAPQQLSPAAAPSFSVHAIKVKHIQFLNQFIDRIQIGTPAPMTPLDVDMAVLSIVGAEHGYVIETGQQAKQWGSLVPAVILVPYQSVDWVELRPTDKDK